MSTNKVILEIDEYLMLLGENVNLKVSLAECIDLLCDHINPLYQEEVRYKYKIPMSTTQTDCMVLLVKNNILNDVLSKLCQITPDPAGKVNFEEVLAQFKGSLDVVTVTEEQPQEKEEITEELFDEVFTNGSGNKSKRKAQSLGYDY